MNFNKQFYKNISFWLSLITVSTVIENIVRNSFSYLFWISLIVSIFLLSNGLFVKDNEKKQI
ncbi:hypothetical protein [Companilactobacillus insicii]|uniref:hypothetical protein n=1 Tax=Companilactobacillus insicii TaxID=1732567 RepID=UPI000F7924A8|nr:hypothetical protein [Companilactobacillus insicii]